MVGAASSHVLGSLESVGYKNKDLFIFQGFSSISTPSGVRVIRFIFNRVLSQRITKFSGFSLVSVHS